MRLVTRVRQTVETGVAPKAETTVRIRDSLTGEPVYGTDLPLKHCFPETCQNGLFPKLPTLQDPKDDIRDIVTYSVKFNWIRILSFFY